MKYQKIKNCKIGKNTKIYDFVNLYDCEIGESCMIGTFVEIQKGVKIGNNVRIQSHSFVPEGVVIEDNVFVGHGVMFTNDKKPRSSHVNSSRKEKAWKLEKVLVRKGASIGSNTTIVGPVTIGEKALIGAGSVVTKNVPPNTTVAGNPARQITNP